MFFLMILSGWREADSDLNALPSFCCALKCDQFQSVSPWSGSSVGYEPRKDTGIQAARHCQTQ